MDNPVVGAVARALAADGVAVLRFNFGGVGRSGRAWSGGGEEVRDVHASLEALSTRLPAGHARLLAGYSFGAWAALRAAADGARVDHVLAVAPPVAVLDHGFLDAVRVPIAVIVGERDQYCPAAALDRLIAGRARVRVHRLPRADHFLAGREGDVAALAAASLRASSPSAP